MDDIVDITLEDEDIHESNNQNQIRNVSLLPQQLPTQEHVPADDRGNDSTEELRQLATTPMQGRPSSHTNNSSKKPSTDDVNANGKSKKCGSESGLQSPVLQQQRVSSRTKRQAKPKLDFDPDEQPQHTSRHASRSNSRPVISMETMQAHLLSFCIGLRPRDPSVSELPNTLPTPEAAARPADIATIHLGLLSQSRLNELAAATETTNCFDELLPQPPGAPKDRLAYFTGQAPSADLEQKPLGTVAGTRWRALSPQQLVEALKPHLSCTKESEEEVAWSVVGRPAGFCFRGKRLHLRPLWDLVQAHGGSEKVSAEKKWASICRKLGYDPTTASTIASKVKRIYARYVQPFEFHQLGKLGAADVDPQQQQQATQGEEDSGEAMDVDRNFLKIRSDIARASMAQSLLCKDCNTLLRSVKEAQDHADATGHANFEESTEAVKKLVCGDCNKICRNDTERDLHTKRTGHTNFEDRTGEENDPMDTEKQMAEARAELHGDADTAPGSSGPAPEELVPAEVDETIVEQMMQMGFGRNRSVRAIYSSGGSSIDAAVTWLADHEADEDVDSPLMVPKATAKKKLTPEEAKEQAQELFRKAKERRDAEEKERERLRERERVRAGKELAAIARLEEDNRLRLIAEERAREKAEEQRAREKIKRKLEEDRRERRRRLGLPEELTEEELVEERRREREKAEEEARRRLPVKPIAKAERMRQILVDMKKSHQGQDEAVRGACQTLLKFITNVGLNPSEEKYRRIRLTNPNVQKRMGAFHGAVEFLEVCGFQKDATGENLEMPADAVDKLVLEVGVEALTSAIENPFFGVL